MKIGDRVKVISEDSLMLGHIGTIVRPYYDYIGVEFDKYLELGHDCDGYGKDGYCQYILKSDLELIYNEPEEGIIKWYKNGELI